MLLLLCIKIFLVRILDVSLGTVRTILVIRGKRHIASIIGFIEVAIWFTIVRAALNTTETSTWIIIAYAGGFATGTFIGGFISDKFIKGNLSVQVVTEKKDEIIDILRNEGYGVSVIGVEGKNKDKKKYILIIHINKKRFNHLRDTIKRFDKKAFIVVNETKYIQNGYFK